MTINMNLPHLLQQLESGFISAAQAEQEIRDEIERVKDNPPNHVSVRSWVDALDRLKIAFELETKPHKHEQTSINPINRTPAKKTAI